MYDMAREMDVLGVSDDNVAVDWRYGQILSDEWTPKDVSTLRVYEWDRINFAPGRIERVCEIWGMTIEEINQTRKETRDSLTFAAPPVAHERIQEVRGAKNRKVRTHELSLG
jgi:hypothetical protein